MSLVERRSEQANVIAKLVLPQMGHLQYVKKALKSVQTANLHH